MRFTWIHDDRVRQLRDLFPLRWRVRWLGQMGGGAEEESTTCDMGQTRTKLSERRPNLNPLFSHCFLSEGLSLVAADDNIQIQINTKTQIRRQKRGKYLRHSINYRVSKSINKTSRLSYIFGKPKQIWDLIDLTRHLAISETFNNIDVNTYAAFKIYIYLATWQRFVLLSKDEKDEKTDEKSKIQKKKVKTSKKLCWLRPLISKCTKLINQKGT